MPYALWPIACAAYFLHLHSYKLLLQGNCFLHIRRPTIKHVNELEIFLAMYTRHIQVYIKSEVISSMSTFFKMAESHIGYATFGDEVDRSMTHLKESLVENILRAVRQVFLAKHSSSGKVKNSDDTSETIQSSHAFDSRNMNRNLDLHVMEEGEELSIVVCEELSCYVY
jgi:hypothetical protein